MGDCTPALPKSLFCDPLQPMPKSIKALGIFPMAPDLTQHPASMHEFVPDPPLWSDGMEKQRFIVLPAGKKIDNTNPKEWIFPIGTVLIKTFFDDGGAAGKPHPIETRLIRRVGEKDAALEYEFFVYQSAPDGSDATLLVNDQEGDINKDATVMITINRMIDGYPVNGGMPFPHTLPSRQACGDCHEKNGKVAQTFIGFDELRLNSKLSATSTKTQLQELAGLFMNPPPANPATITDKTADPNMQKVKLRIKQFVFGNCVHCHNGQEVVDFHPDVFEMNTINQKTDAQSVVPPKGWLRIVPGHPELSVVFVQTQRTPLPAPTGMGTANRLRPMPPVGVADVAAPKAAVNDLKTWIMSLPATPAK